MTQDPVEFRIRYWVTGESGRVTVIGRVGAKPIHVNDIFDTLCRFEKRRYPEEKGNDPVVKDEKKVALKVACIRAYDRSLDVLSQGMTGSLMLEGEGPGSVAPGWVLRRRSCEI